MLLLDLHNVGVGVFTLATVMSLLCMVAKPLGKEVKTAALVWIDVVRSIQLEWRKSAIVELPCQKSQPLDQTRSKRELGKDDP